MHTTLPQPILGLLALALLLVTILAKPVHYTVPFDLAPASNPSEVNAVHPEQRGLRKRQCTFQYDPTDINLVGPGQWVCDDQLPNIGEFLERMQDTTSDGRATATNSVIFYTNLDNVTGLALGYGWMKLNNKPCYSLTDALDPNWYQTQGSWVSNLNPQLFQGLYADGESGFSVFSTCFDQAVAFAAVNPDAYLFTRSDGDPSPTSAWTEVEFPMLTRNPAIQRVWRVDPRDPAEGGDGCNPPKKIWDRNLGDPLAPLTSRYCPPELAGDPDDFSAAASTISFPAAATSGPPITDNAATTSLLAAETSMMAEENSMLAAETSMSTPGTATMRR